MIGQRLAGEFPEESRRVCVNPVSFLTMRQFIIFTDLDGTLMDHDTYAFHEAEAALAMLKGRSIPVIICSSKTRAEIEVCRRRMGLRAPFIVENGAAIFVPRGTLDVRGEPFVERAGYHVLELGAPYPVLCRTWEAIKDEEEFLMTGFSEMTVQQISQLTGLATAEARLAAMREYSQPFVFSDTAERRQRLERLVKQRGLQVTRGGRFYHLLGQNDKGKAVEVLKKLYAQTSPGSEIRAVGLGDSANDVPMLEAVDVPVVIRKKTGQWEDFPVMGPVVRSQKPGPQGWAEEVTRIVSEGSRAGYGGALGFFVFM